MIYLIIKSYLILLILVLAGAVAAFFSIVYFIFKATANQSKTWIDSPEKDGGLAITQTDKIKKQIINITSNDIKAIAGDDEFATQLDLARAYIETGKVQLAKKILEYVLEKGNHIQQQEAQELLGFI